MARAFEEADGDRLLLSGHERSLASRLALNQARDADATPAAGPPSATPALHSATTLAVRAEALLEPLGRRLPALAGILEVTRLGAWLPLIIIVGSLVIGLMTNALGPRRQINLLSFPLFLLLAWNLVIYLGMILATIIRPLRRRPLGAARRLTGIFLRGALWRSGRSWIGARQRSSGLAAEAGIVTAALAGYGALWLRHAGPLLTARVRRALHLGALAMISGAVGGMYLRGFAFEYRATWESTLLDASHVQSLLQLVLGPAAAILRVSLPDVAPLRGPGGDGDAALWIHLYAITALLVVLLPRMAMALAESWRAHRLAGAISLDLDDSYCRRLFAEWRGARKQVRITPYSFSPSPAVADRLKSLLYDYFGARADIQLRKPVTYGSEVEVLLTEETQGDAIAGATATDICHVVLFNLAQSPEIEVHGDFLEELKGRLGEPGSQLLLLIDPSAYQQRVPAPERWEERLRAWQRIGREAALPIVALPVDEPDWQAALATLRGALWPDTEPAPSGAS